MTRLALAALLALSLVAPGPALADGCPPGPRPCEDRVLPGAVAPRSDPAPLVPPIAGLAGAPAPRDNAPSLLGALLRLFGAVLVVGGVLAAVVFAYRRLVLRGGARPQGMLAWATGWSADGGADGVRVGTRRYLGARESIAVVHAGGERFLIGITGTQISLLARLESPEAEQPAGDFTETLSRAALTDESLQAAVSRSRERLGRLAHLSVVEGERRG